ncbi:hypothetical protein [Niabella sp.]|uniref:hypothetical protein n=1 Tax=Niabella sp. TaxID=1962976 RepID=UPI00260F7EE4|nr:hypothetical protein [Niabella sp.]
MKIKTVLLTLLYTLAAADLHAQQDGFLSFSAPQYLPETFYQTFRNDLPVYNGRLYQGYLPTITGTPFVDEDQWIGGVVFFDSTWYKDLQLKYDAVAGELQVENPAKMPVILPNNRLYAFTLGQRKFVQLGMGNNNQLSTGFYEILSEGRLTALVLRRKTIKETTGQSVVEREFIWGNRFFIHKDGVFYPVNSKRNLYAIIKEKKAAIHKALKRNDIRFRKNPEAAIKMATQLYNQD